MNIDAVKTGKETIAKFKEVVSQLISVLLFFGEEEFNTIPFEGSWTAGQVAEHLYKSVSGLPALLRSSSEDAGRDPFEKNETIGSIFLDFDKKLKSPSFILPSADRKTVSFFTDGFAKIVSEIEAEIQDHDLSKLYTGFTLPQLGNFTGWEWIYFATTHTIRHTRQLRNIHQKLKSR